MPYYEVTVEDVGFTDSRKASDVFLSSNQILRLMREERHEKLLPAGVMCLREAYVTPDDGQGKTDIKVFMPVRFVVEAESEAHAEDMRIPRKFLDKVACALSRDVSLEGNWEVTEVYPTEPEYPSLRWLVAELRNNAHSRVPYKVLGAHVIGSEAKGTARPDSDLDVAVIIPASSRVSALKRTERYHAKFTQESQRATWGGRKVDIQFFYPDDPELASYQKQPVSAV